MFLNNNLFKKKNTLAGDTARIVLAHPEHRWPLWMTEQFTPESPAYCGPKAQNELENNARNNYTLLSVPRSQYYLMVDPLGNIVHTSQSWQLETWVCQKNVFLSPEKAENLSQHYLPESQSLITKYNYGDLTITLTHFVQGFERHPDLGFQQIRIKNNSLKSFKGDLIIAIRPYSTAGIGAIQSINYIDIASGAVLVNNQLEILCEHAPDDVISAPFNDGDAAQHIYDWQMILSSLCPDKKASGQLKFNLDLDANSEQAITIKLPLKTIPAAKANSQAIKNVIHAISELTFDAQLLDLTHQTSKIFLAGSLLLFSPLLFGNAYNANSQFLFSLLKEEIQDDFTRYFTYFTVIQLGMGARIYPLFSAQLIHKKNNTKRPLSAITLDLLCTLDYLIHLQNTEETRLQLGKLSQWFTRLLKRKLHYIKDYDVTLIKSSGPLNVLDSLWILVCLKHLSVTLKSLHLNEVSEQFVQQAETLNQQVMSYLSLLEKKTGITHYPAQSTAPFSEDIFSYFYLSLFGLHLDSIRLNNTLELINAHFKRDAAIFSKGVFNIPKTLLFLNTTMRIPSSDFTNTLEWFLNRIPKTFAIPSTLHPKTYQGSLGKGHDILSTALFLNVVKHMMVASTDDTLILLPRFPKTWLQKADFNLEVHHLQTQFGIVSFSLRKTPLSYILSIQATFTKQPLGIKLTFPEKISAFTVDNGREKKAGQYTLSIPSAATSVVFQLEHDDS